jgi:hypothetical protein
MGFVTNFWLLGFGFETLPVGAKTLHCCARRHGTLVCTRPWTREASCDGGGWNEFSEGEQEVSRLPVVLGCEADVASCSGPCALPHLTQHRLVIVCRDLR